MSLCRPAFRWQTIAYGIIVGNSIEGKLRELGYEPSEYPGPAVDYGFYSMLHQPRKLTPRSTYRVSISPSCTDQANQSGTLSAPGLWKS